MGANLSLERKNGVSPSPGGSTTGQTGNQASAQGGRGTVKQPTLVDQPLSALYTNKYIPTNLKYPSNLDSDVRGHIIQFSINDTIPSSYDEKNNKFSVDQNTNTVNSDLKSDLFFQPKRTRIAQTIALYIPETISENYQSNYTDVSVLDAIKEIGSAMSSLGGAESSAMGNFIGGIGSIATSTIDTLQSNTGKLAGSALGVAINPNKQILFDGIEFRTFQFTFTFSPKSLPESDIVNQIIKTFKYHAAPTIGTGLAAAFFTPPSSFTIEYLYNGSTNTYVNRIAECVLESINVNYAPNGIWSAFDSTGAPTQVTISLQFKELELIDRNKINQGF
jgi:hypothetical protein